MPEVMFAAAITGSNGLQRASLGLSRTGSWKFQRGEEVKRVLNDPILRKTWIPQVRIAVAGTNQIADQPGRYWPSTPHVLGEEYVSTHTLVGCHSLDVGEQRCSPSREIGSRSRSRSKAGFDVPLKVKTMEVEE
jgi:hypothetical protein